MIEENITKEFSNHKKHVLELASRHLVPGRVKRFMEMGVPLVIGKREGYYLWDIDGHQLMDFHLNGGTFNVGHRNQEIVDSLQQGMETLDIGNHHFPSETRSLLAEQLSKLTPGDLVYSVLTSSGSEANDVAIKSARYATGRRKIIALDVAYHGRTGLSGAAGDDAVARFFHSDQQQDFMKVPFNDLAAMENALLNGDVAAVLMETIPATQGFPVPDAEYLPAVKALCEKYGALYIADEVQTGLSRSGKYWGVDVWGVSPDILVCGKGLSGGMYPIAAAVMSPSAGEWLNENPWGHVSTFGGAELGCPVALKVLEICNREDVKINARDIAQYLSLCLQAIQKRHPFLVEIRQQGLILGLKFDHPEGGVLMSKCLYAQGIWAMFAGFDLSVLQFKPGLLIDHSYCDLAMEKFEAAIAVAEHMTTSVSFSINPK